jgi:hypothetical protein
MRTSHRIATAITTLFTLLVVAGCSRRMLTAPEPEPESASVATEVTAPAPPSGRLAGPSILGTGIKLPPILPLLADTWRLVTATLVRVGEVTTVRGERYELQFSPGSLSQDALITIKDYDPDILDVELGPHGTKFGEPVVLSIDFTGTRSDPGSEWYDHSEPVVYWLNETKNQWEEVPSTTDWQSRKIHVRLEHFSRYVVGGKAGWKGQPNREQD